MYFGAEKLTSCYNKLNYSLPLLTSARVLIQVALSLSDTSLLPARIKSQVGEEKSGCMHSLFDFKASIPKRCPKRPLKRLISVNVMLKAPHKGVWLTSLSFNAGIHDHIEDIIKNDKT